MASMLTHCHTSCSLRSHLIMMLRFCAQIICPSITCNAGTVSAIAVKYDDLYVSLQPGSCAAILSSAFNQRICLRYWPVTLLQQATPPSCRADQSGATCKRHVVAYECMSQQVHGHISAEAAEFLFTGRLSKCACTSTIQYW